MTFIYLIPNERRCSEKWKIYHHPKPPSQKTRMMNKQKIVSPIWTFHESSPLHQSQFTLISRFNPPFARHPSTSHNGKVSRLFSSFSFSSRPRNRISLSPPLLSIVVRLTNYGVESEKEKKRWEERKIAIDRFNWVIKKWSGSQVHPQFAHNFSPQANYIVKVANKFSSVEDEHNFHLLYIARVIDE